MGDKKNHIHHTSIVNDHQHHVYDIQGSSQNDLSGGYAVVENGITLH